MTFDPGQVEQLTATSDLEFSPHSTNDPAGRIFKWRDQLYRGIRPSHAELFGRLFEQGTIQRLVDKGLLVESQRTSFSLNAYPLVVRHRQIPVVSHPLEWSPSMLRDAALVTLDLNIELVKEGLVLQDAHPWNILFDGPWPRHVDLTSIKPLKSDDLDCFEDEFLSYFLYPLVLMSTGREALAESLMYADGGIRRSDLFRLMPARTILSLGLEVARKQLGRFRSPQARQIERMESIRRAVECIRIPSRQPQTPEPTESERNAVREVLAPRRPKTVLLVDSSDWAASMFAGAQVQPTVAIDSRWSTDNLYRAARQSVPNVLPLQMDLEKATAAFGQFGRPSGDAVSRLKSDMVLAPQLTSRLNADMERGGSEYLLKALGMLSKRWAVFGVAPRAELASRLPEFRSLIGRAFRSCEEITLNSGLFLFICEMPL
jgi:hypothetical protein